MATSLFRDSILGKPSFSGADIRVYAISRDPRYTQEAIRELNIQASTLSDLRDIAAVNGQDDTRIKGEFDFLLGEIARLEKQLKLLNNTSLIPLTELQTLSISIYREKTAVRALGSTYPRGFARGPRSLAGSMIFTTFDEHVLAKLLRAGSRHQDVDLQSLASTTLSDQLPPIDLLIQFANEYGDASEEIIYGVEFISEGHTLSIEDLLLENVMQWQAIDIDLMRNIRVGKVGDPAAQAVEQPSTARSLLNRPEMRAYLNRASGFDGFTAYEAKQ